MAPHRDVLLIIADQRLGDCFGFPGLPGVRTQHLDALARQGATFTRHFGQSAPYGLTPALMLTGPYGMNHRVAADGVPVGSRYPNLALELPRAG